MNKPISKPTADVLGAQHLHWENTYAKEPYLYGEAPSLSARKAANLFKTEGAHEILELGCGHGRDTFFFVQNGLKVHGIEFSKTAIDAMLERAYTLGFSDSLTVIRHDARERLPFESLAFDGCYSHMLYCMALTTSQLQSLSQEIRRVLRAKGLNIYTARNTSDPHYGKGIRRGEDMYEVDGFIVHFFSQEKIVLLAEGFQILGVEQFDEGDLPRRLSLVTLRKT
jgi:SAM-dependent methyltransferase